MKDSVAAQAHKALPAPAWRKAERGGASAPLLLTSPHSGTLYPDQMRENLKVAIEDLSRTEDAFVDKLFESAPEAGASMISAVYARSYVDLNRDARELDPAMIDGKPPRASSILTPRVEAGLGCLPRVGASGREIYKKRLSPAEVESRLSNIHDSYHSEVRRELFELRETWGEAFLLDCHSMPSVQPGRRALPDIVLGDRFGSSCSSRMIGLVERTLRKMGYSVARNSPYAGGFTTRLYGRPRSGIHALQIEVNRKLYMNERTIEKSENFDIIQGDMAELTSLIAEFARSRTSLQFAAE